MVEAKALAACRCGAMVAPAGFGKTQVIAHAVAKHGGGRELILTHTHAGIEAIRRRLNSFQVPGRAFQIDTIASLALRLATAFPKSSKIECAQPRSNTEYSAVYRSATSILNTEPIKEIIRASYTGVYVDEYQDCTVQQHDFVLALKSVIPCRIVGDPLQGIFKFGDNDTVVWRLHVEPNFNHVNGPTIPRRWSSSNNELGTWLQDVRSRLESGQDIDLRGAPVIWKDGSNPNSMRINQLAACREAASRAGDSVIAIHHWQRQCHDIASKLNGQFSCIEAIDTKDLFLFAERFDNTVGMERAVTMIDFAATCSTKTATEYKTMRNALANGKIPNLRKHKDCLDLLVKIAQNSPGHSLAEILVTLCKSAGGIVYRRELLREMIRTFRLAGSGEAPNMLDASWAVRNRTRQQGRLLPKCAVGTTLLVKGLEFDHAVVLDADSYDAENLYVALTRGSRSLTVISRSRVIRPTSSSSTPANN